MPAADLVHEVDKRGRRIPWSGAVAPFKLAAEGL
jgi:hypothetical protein